MPADEPDPPRKFYEFKPNEFESVNPLTNAPQPTPPIDVPTLLRQANSSKPGGVARPSPASQPNEVHGVLQENISRANALGLNELKPLEKRPSRRKRDFWLLVISGNLFFALAFLLAPNPVVFAFGVGSMAFLTGALAWVMFCVMDDY